jgi:hypothetical protein
MVVGGGQFVACECLVRAGRKGKRMGPASGEKGNCKKYQNSVNEANNLLKTKEVTFSRGAKRTQNEPKKGSKNHLSDVFEAEFARHESPEAGQPQGG